MKEPGQSGELVFKGIPVSAGVCRGKILVLEKHESAIPRFEVKADEISAQLKRFEQALVATRQQILDVQRQVSQALNADEAGIFEAHLLVLEDPMLIESVTTIVNTKKINVEAAFKEFADKYTASLSAVDDAYLRERVADIRDVTSRIMGNLLGHGPRRQLAELKEPCILITDDLSPSDLAVMNRNAVLGFGAAAGGKTSHSAIMARSLRVPAVVGLHEQTRKIQDGSYALLDGYNGVIIVNPTDQTLFEYGQLIRRQVSIEEKLKSIQNLPAMTLDGKEIMLSANIEQPGDTEAVKQFGGAGVGLFRTEYLFLNRDTLPTEEEQYEAYRQVARELKPHPVIIRTLDLGGDKFLSHLGLEPELNPFLGWRAIRYCLEKREVFRDQLRAILRASAEGNVKIMYPMISCRAEIEKANAFLDEYKRELRAENVSFDEKIQIGAMIEIPSAAVAADTLAKHVQFFSIGTNDLIQYSLAVDRLNEKIAHLYDPTHPAIVRLIKMTADAARQNGIWCGVCGEMASDPLLTPLLLGLGVEELSVTPPLLPQVKFLVRRLKMDDAKEMAEQALKLHSGKEILELSQAMAKRVAPALFESETT